jgi:hypothetical protein
MYTLDFVHFKRKSRQPGQAWKDQNEELEGVSSVNSEFSSASLSDTDIALPD